MGGIFRHSVESGRRTQDSYDRDGLTVTPERIILHENSRILHSVSLLSASRTMMMCFIFSFGRNFPCEELLPLVAGSL